MFQRLKDYLLERRISAAMDDLVASKSAEEAREQFKEMARLIRLRSDAQVERMERKRGLC